KKEYEEQRQFFEAEKKKSFETHEAQLQRNQDMFRKELMNQKNEFHEAYTRNEATNREALGGQRERLVNALKTQKTEIMESLGKYSDRKTDPFYRMTA